MRYAGIQELRELTDTDTTGTDVIAVQRDGRTLGYFLPAPRRDEATTGNLFTDLRLAIAKVRDETGLSEDELADLFDLSKPFE